MQKRFISLFLILVIAVFIFSGCGGYQSRTNRPEDEDYHRGTQGLVMEFVDNNPPDRIYDSSHSYADSFNIIVELRNEGASTPVNYKWYLSGFDPGILLLGSSAEKTNVEGTLEGKSVTNPYGGYALVEWIDNDVVLPMGTDKYEPRILITSCYDYVTEASIPVCIDPRPYDAHIRDEVCTPYTETSTGQGAPVAVTRVEVVPLTGKVQFKITIENRGDGSVIHPLAVPWNCPNNLVWQDLNQVDVYVSLPSAAAGSCTPANPIRLVEDRGYVYCMFDGLGGESAYNTILNVELVYGYTSSIYKNIQVIRIPE